MNDKLKEAFQAGFEKEAQENPGRADSYATPVLEALGGLAGGAAGGIGGTMLGASFGRPRLGAALGGGLGASAGMGAGNLASRGMTGESAPHPSTRQRIRRLQRAGYEVQ